MYTASGTPYTTYAKSTQGTKRTRSETHFNRTKRSLCTILTPPPTPQIGVWPIFKIHNRNNTKKLAVIHLNNMFPIIPSEIETIDFNQQEAKYRNLLRDEYRFVIQNQEAMVFQDESPFFELLRFLVFVFLSKIPFPIVPD